MRIRHPALSAIKWLWLLLTICSSPAFGQQCAEESTVQGFTVRAVRVEARFGRVPEALKQKLALHRGEKYSSDKGTLYAEETKEFINSSASQIEDDTFGLDRLRKLSIRVGLYTWCPIPVADHECRAEFPTADHCVDLLIRTKSVQLDMLNIGGNVLPVPRSNRLDFFREVPKPLLVLNPGFTVTSDRTAGTSPGFSISTDLLDLTPTGDKSTAAKNPNELRLDLQGSKSIEEPFYNAGGALRFVRNRPLSRLDRLNFFARFNGSDAPQAGDEYFRTAVSTGIDLGFSFPGAPLHRVTLGGGYRWSRNKLPTDAMTESSFDGHVIAEGRVAGGFARIAGWLDGASPSQGDSYGRIVGVLGYAREVPVAENQTVGFEGIVGAGGSFGSPPPYARFFGGNWQGNFLYEGAGSPTLAEMPPGPLLRSAGRGQIGTVRSDGARLGATSYWHANFNVSVPIPGLSRPLIPPEVIRETTDASGVVHRITLKDVLKSQVKNGKVFFIKTEARGRLTPEQQDALALDENDPLTPEERERLKNATEAYNRAQAEITPEADRLWSQITPITNFISDQANLFSIKPMLMLDVARLNASDAVDNRTRFGIGGGLQFTVVIARFEAGYIYAVRRASGDPSGNFVVRLVFQNLF